MKYAPFEVNAVCKDGGRINNDFTFKLAIGYCIKNELSALSFFDLCYKAAFI